MVVLLSEDRLLGKWHFDRKGEILHDPVHGDSVDRFVVRVAYVALLWLAENSSGRRWQTLASCLGCGLSSNPVAPPQSNGCVVYRV